MKRRIFATIASCLLVVVIAFGMMWAFRPPTPPLVAVVGEMRVGVEYAMPESLREEIIQHADGGTVRLMGASAPEFDAQRGVWPVRSTDMVQQEPSRTREGFDIQNVDGRVHYVDFSGHIEARFVGVRGITLHLDRAEPVYDTQREATRIINTSTSRQVDISTPQTPPQTPKGAGDAFGELSLFVEFLIPRDLFDEIYAATESISVELSRFRAEFDTETALWTIAAIYMQDEEWPIWASNSPPWIAGTRSGVERFAGFSDVYMDGATIQARFLNGIMGAPTVFYGDGSTAGRTPNPPTSPQVQVPCDGSLLEGPCVNSGAYTPGIDPPNPEVENLD